MKKLIMLMVLAVGIGVIGEDILKDKFLDATVGSVPTGWAQNKGKWAEPLGEVKVVKELERNVVQVTSQTKSTHVYTNKMYDAKAGDVFELEVEAKGKGSVKVGIYVYDATGKWVSSEGKAFNVTADKFEDYDAKITVKDLPAKGDKPAMVAAKVRFYFEATANSDIFIKEFKADKED